MTTVPVDRWDSQKAWRRVRLEAEAAKNYPLSYALYIGQTHRDAILESLLPTLLCIKAIAILDDSLEKWLDEKGHVLSSPYRNDLNGRLCFLGDRKIVTNVPALHAARRRRNSFAHESHAECSWSDLQSALSSIETCLIELGLARSTQNLEYYCERSALEQSIEEGVRFCRRFTYGVKENGIPALTVEWTQKFLNDEG